LATRFAGRKRSTGSCSAPLDCVLRRPRRSGSLPCASSR
jgi:hypothetical protein